MMTMAPATVFLLAINVLVSLHALFVDQESFEKYAFRPFVMVRDQEWYRVLSGAFLHGSIMHLLFNMMTLYFFGPFLEVQLGITRFLIVYFGSLLAAHAYGFLRHKDDPDYTAVGASGAISGVLLAFCLFRPMDEIFLFLIPIGIPAFIFAILFIAFSSYAVRDADAKGGGGKIAHDAHLGGAIGGLLLTVLLEPGVLKTFVAQLPF